MSNPEEEYANEYARIPRFVRDYTAEEKARIDEDYEAGTPERLHQIIDTVIINTARYTQAAEDFPNKAEYFERLAVNGSPSIEAWKQVYRDIYEVELPDNTQYFAVVARETVEVVSIMTAEEPLVSNAS